MDETKPKPWESCQTHGRAAPNVWACPTCLVELRRWKLKNAPRMKALKRRLTVAQLEADAGREENARLTDEVERLRAQDVDSLLAVNAAQAEEIERQRHVIRQLELLVKRLENA